MDNKRKRREESDIEANLKPSEIEDSDALEPMKQRERKYLKKLKKQKKKIYELSNSLNEMTEIVKKLQKKSDVPEISLKEKETPKECCFEDKDAYIKNRQTIFVQGFNCSFPRDEIKSSLKKHFSSCGLVTGIFIPFHCKTGSPLGYAFINMAQDSEKALKLNRSILGGQILLVTMAIKREEYSNYKNHHGCERCRRARMKRQAERFHESFIVSPEYISQLCREQRTSTANSGCFAVAATCLPDDQLHQTFINFVCSERTWFKQHTGARARSRTGSNIHMKFEATLEPSEIEDSDPLARKKQHERKYLKKLRKQEKKIDELSNRLKEITEIVKKLQKNSDVPEISLKEKETPKKECCFESKDGDLLNRKSIFVKGFRCSLPREEIKSALKKHFSSCGLVTNIFVPFHCKTGSPVGYAFINMAKDVEKALKLDGMKLLGRGDSVCYDGNRQRRILWL